MEVDKPGYKRPPRATQFKRGRSGNPKGRPRGVRSLKTDLTKLMKKRLRIREDGEQRHVSGQELMLLKLFEQAAKGDIKATTQIIGMLIKLDASEPPEKKPEVVTENDRAIIADFMRRNTPSKDEVEP